MLNIILYVLIGSGISYFIFLIYKKWSQIQREDSPSIKFFGAIIKRASQRLIAYFKQIPKKCKQLRIKNILDKIKKINFVTIKEFFKKEKILRFFSFTKELKIKTKNKINIISNALKRGSQRMARIVKKVKFPRLSRNKPLFKTKFLEKNETNLEIPNNKKGKRFFSSIVLKAKRSIKKRRIPQFHWGNLTRRGKARLSAYRQTGAKNFGGRVKIRFFSKEDQEIKKQFNRTKEAIVNPESYLGELLKKKEGDKIVSRETNDVSSQNDVVKNSLSNPVAKKNIKIIEMIKSIKRLNILRIIKDARNRKKQKTKTLKEINKENKFLAPPNIEISEEAIKKMENKLISEISEDPKNIEAYKKLGKAYYNQDKYRYAEECFKAAIKLGSGDKKIKDLLDECEKK